MPELWKEETVEVLRVLLSDLDPAQPTYAESNLLRVILVAALQVGQEMSFAHDFVVNVCAQTITPDPAGVGRDESFLNLSCLKAACIVDRGSASRARGLLIKDGPILFDAREDYKGKIALLEKGWCAVYEDAKLEHLLGDGVAGAAVMSPFRRYMRNEYRSFLGYPGEGGREYRF